MITERQSENDKRYAVAGQVSVEENPANRVMLEIARRVFDPAILAIVANAESYKLIDIETPIIIHANMYSSVEDMVESKRSPPAPINEPSDMITRPPI